MVLTSSTRMTFSLDNDICNSLDQWTSVHGCSAASGKLR